MPIVKLPMGNPGAKFLAGERTDKTGSLKVSACTLSKYHKRASGTEHKVIWVSDRGLQLQECNLYTIAIHGTEKRKQLLREQ